MTKFEDSILGSFNTRAMPKRKAVDYFSIGFQPKVELLARFVCTKFKLNNLASEDAFGRKFVSGPGNCFQLSQRVYQLSQWFPFLHIMGETVNLTN